MVAGTLEQFAPDNSAQLTQNDLAWLNALETQTWPSETASIERSVKDPDIPISHSLFASADVPGGGTKAKELAVELLNLGDETNYFDLAHHLKAAKKPSRTVGETYLGILRTSDGRRKLGHDICRWVGAGSQTPEELQKAQALQELLLTSGAADEELLAAQIGRLFDAIPRQLKITSRAAAMAITLTATAFVGSGAVTSPEQPREIKLADGNIPELIFNHELIEIPEVADKAVRDFVERAEEVEKQQAISPEHEHSASEPKLLETIVQIADEGNRVTLLPAAVVAPEPQLEGKQLIGQDEAAPDTRVGITVSFPNEKESDAVISLLESQQEYLNVQIIKANESGVIFIADTNAAVLDAEVALPVDNQPQIAEAPAGPLDQVNLEAIPDINGVKKQLISEFVAYLIEKKGLTAQGAAYITGNFLKESNLDPTMHGGGLAQLQGVRRIGMPLELYAQIDFLLDIEIDRDGGSPQLNTLLRDPDASIDDIEAAIFAWERWRYEGERFEYGAQILEAIQTPKVEVDPRLNHRLINPDSVEQINGIDTVLVGGFRANLEIALNLANLLQEAEDEGVDLGGGGFRTNERQIELRIAHGCGGSRIYKSSCRGNPPTAVPGRSMHEQGMAFDFTHNGVLITSRRNNAFVWLAENAGKHGLYNLPSEPWHWSTNGR
jgi:hypothetical protein